VILSYFDTLSSFAGKFVVFFAVGLATVISCVGQPSIPDTQAGTVLRAWINAFNSGDRASIQNYIKTVDSTQSLEGMLAFRNQTGGFELLAIESSEPLHIRFRVKEKASSTTALGNFLVKDTRPPTVDTFGLRAIPAGVTPENITLEAPFRKRVIEEINSRLGEFYIDPLIGRKMQDALTAHMNDGDYDSITDGDVFATRLTEDLRAISHDKHLGVNFNPFRMPPRQEPTADENARMRRQLEHDNCAFTRVEILPGNKGYLKFNAFMPPDICGPTVIAAMNFIAHTDAVIVDLRENGGGDPAMVTFVASFFFDKPTHLNDLYNRKENSTQQFWTLPYLLAERFAKQPVFVLTSKRTFSGAEEFSYDLKTQRRAIIVGEVTGGGAHPVGGHPVADYFVIGVPFAKAVNPVTHTDWEGTGVDPDVKVSSAEALSTAEKLANDKIDAERSTATAPH
jgi:retinol-binding protein 3